MRHFVFSCLMYNVQSDFHDDKCVRESEREVAMKTIIIYSTKYGSVEKAALKLKEHLQGDVEISSVKNVSDFSFYDTVILAGSVYAGKIQKEMRHFVRSQLEELLKKRVGLFICAGSEEEKNIDIWIKENFTRKLYNIAVARDNLGFEYNYEKLNLLEKIIVRIVGGVKESKSIFYDEKIRDFAGKINQA